MKGLILACLVIVAVSGQEELGATFQSFKVKFDKAYKNQAEEIKRFIIFKDNLRSIEEHNARYEKSLETYTKGVNQFSDMTLEEFKAFLTLSSTNRPQFNGTKYVKSEVDIPESVDWISQGHVTEVKNQGSCGSCWAFSVTGSTEAAFRRKSQRILVSLSAQQLVDCTRDINDGCNGGYLDQTFPYIRQYGLVPDATYPYTALDGDCQYNSDAVVTKIDGYVYFNAGDEGALLNAVGSVGPVSVAMDATYLGQYSSGIYTDNQCSSTELNHAVLVVGYGTENNTPYWIVKNSWGADFGEQGYFRIIRGQNQCGIATDMCYPYIE